MVVEVFGGKAQGVDVGDGVVGLVLLVGTLQHALVARTAARARGGDEGHDEEDG